jgi:dolichol-phosphate mannosyltransferase
VYELDMVAHTYSIVIPVYNEEDIIDSLLEDICNNMAQLGEAYEILVVDDGSEDRTWEILLIASERYPAITAYRLSRNFGHQAAIYAGLTMAQGRAVGIMDGDGQDPPAVIVQMFRHWQEGYDVVYGVRRKRKEHLLKRFLYFAYYRILRKIASIDIPLDSGDFCVMDRRVVDFILSMEDRSPFLRGLRSWYGGRQLPLEYERAARQGGEVKYSYLKLMDLSISGITSFSKLPLRLAIFFGGITCFATFSYGLILVLRKLMFHSPTYGVGAGLSSLIVVAAFVGGLALLLVGLLGEYIMHIFASVKKFPVFIVRESSKELDSTLTPTHEVPEKRGNEQTGPI